MPLHVEFARYLDIAARSLKEIEDRLIEAVDSKLLTNEQAAPAFNLAQRAGVAVAHLTTYLRKNP